VGEPGFSYVIYRLFSFSEQRPSGRHVIRKVPAAAAVRSFPVPDLEPARTLWSCLALRSSSGSQYFNYLVLPSFFAQINGEPRHFWRDEFHEDEENPNKCFLADPIVTTGRFCCYPWLRPLQPYVHSEHSLLQLAWTTESTNVNVSSSWRATSTRLANLFKISTTKFMTSESGLLSWLTPNH